MRKIVLGAAALLMAGCASQPEDIQTQYVSELQYRDYDCDQLGMEASRVSGRVNELYAHLDETADNDAAQMGVGLVLFWPTLFFLEGGDGPQAQEYARLKGEREAIEKVAIRKKCSIGFPAEGPKKDGTPDGENIPADKTVS